MLCFVMPVKPFALSYSNAREVACSFARTGSTATPGFSTANVRCHVESSRTAAGCIMVGTKISVTVPVSVPVKGSGPTPTISYSRLAHAKRAPDNFRILCEAPRPIVVREHGVGMRARLQIVVLA